MFSRLLDRLSDAVVITDLSGRIEQWSLPAYSMYGYTRDEALSMNLSQTVPPDKREEWTSILRLVAGGRCVGAMETFRTAKNGTTFAVQFSAVPAGESLRSVFHIARFALPPVDRIQSSGLSDDQTLFALKVAHDLRNPLSILTSVVYLMEHSFERRHLDVMKRQLTICEQVIHNMLDYHAGRRPEQEPFAVGRALRDIVHSFPVSNNIRLHLPAEDGPVAVADAVQFRQVMINLLLNAQEAIGNRPGNVRLSASRQSEKIRIDITDDGGGVEDHVLPRMFEPLFTTKKKGIGLGLTICKELIERNGGSITFEPLSSGAKFSVELPASRHDQLIHR